MVVFNGTLLENCIETDPLRSVEILVPKTEKLVVAIGTTMLLSGNEEVRFVSSAVDEIYDVAVSNLDILRDGVSLSTTKLLLGRALDAVTIPCAVESMVVVITFKELDK